MPTRCGKTLSEKFTPNVTLLAILGIKQLNYLHNRKSTFNKIHHLIIRVRCVNTETEVAGRHLFSFFSTLVNSSCIAKLYI